MKILMLSWRDINHPRKGGAEIVTDIYLKGLAKKGHDITLFTASYPNAPGIEHSGYRIIRKGSQASVWYHGLKYAKKHEKEYDVIIDQVNTIPFFTPLVIEKKKRRAFFHQLCRNIWFYESAFPISVLGNILEWFYLKLYKNTKTAVVSASTKEDLIKYAWQNPDNILVAENQINFKPKTKIKKKENYFVYVGRLTPSKRVEDCIKALSLINDKEAKLYIIGEGKEDYKQRLNNLISDLGLRERVTFTGKIFDEERNKIIEKAKAILATSVREGWGLIVTEANALGTFAITYDVHGLRDANKTGILTNSNTPEELARCMNSLKDSDIRQRSMASLLHAKSHADWQENIRRWDEWVRG